MRFKLCISVILVASVVMVRSAAAAVCAEESCPGSSLEPAVTFDTADEVVAARVLGDATYLVFTSGTRARIARLSKELRSWPTLPGAAMRPVKPDAWCVDAVADGARDRLLLLRQSDITRSALKPTLQSEVYALAPDASPIDAFGAFGRATVGPPQGLQTLEFDWQHHALAVDGVGNVWVATPWIQPGASSGVLRIVRANVRGFEHSDFGPEKTGAAEHPLAAERVSWTGVIPLEAGGAWVVVGTPERTFVFKLRGGGALDESWGDGGVARVGADKDAALSWRGGPFTAAAAIRQGGRLVLVGSAKSGRVAAVALNGQGEPDETFAKAGYFELELGSASGGLFAFGAAAEGEGLVVLGRSRKGEGKSRIFVARLGVAGSLDESHGGGGLVFYEVAGFDSWVVSAATRLPNGEFAFIGRTPPDARSDQTFVVRVPSRAPRVEVRAEAPRAKEPESARKDERPRTPPRGSADGSVEIINAPQVRSSGDAETRSTSDESVAPKNEMYLWEDAAGTVHLTDDPAKIPERFRRAARKL